MQTETLPRPLDLGDPVPDLLDALHLLGQVLGLQEVAEVGVPVRGLVQVQQALVHLTSELFHCSKLWNSDI